MSHPAIRVIGALSILCLLIVGCQPTAPAGLTDADKAAIRQASEEWTNKARGRDFAGVAAVYTEDAILLPPNGEPIQGRSGIESHFGEFPPMSELQLQQIEVEGLGDLAYVRGNYSMKMTLPGTTEPVPESGKYIEIWRKQGDGSWKISRDIYSSNLPAAAPAPAQSPEAKP